jgi:uncharacterized protein (DUF1810 family)
MNDPLNLQRFVDAQDLVYRSVIGELRAGVKQSHWMWFVFPQVTGLGRSATAELYAIQSLDEAKAYLAHPLLGGRLRECTQLMLDVSGKSARQILGNPDDLKFFSSMTLFARAARNETLFRDALMKYFDGKEEATTLKLIGPRIS